MKLLVKTICISTALSSTGLTAAALGGGGRLGQPATEEQKGDKTGTSLVAENAHSSQLAKYKPVASCVSFEAEGTRLELATPCGAPHFQCGR